MSESSVDLRKEQQASLSRPESHYGFLTTMLTASMDLAAGREPSLGKIKFLEILANTPYRAWERRLGGRLGKEPDSEAAQRDQAAIAFAREAIQNETWHLHVVEGKMRADGVKDPWYLSPLWRFPVELSYRLGVWLQTWLNIRGSYKLNAEFEDHAEHSYATFVANHPEFEQQPAEGPALQGFAELKTWSDVFRRMGLDERNHRNRSYLYAGKADQIVSYEGMPKA